METINVQEIVFEKLKEDLVHIFQTKEDIILAYLFGSYLRGKIGGRHDIDIAILIEPIFFNTLQKGQTYRYEAELVAELMRLLKHNRVDLVILNKATPLLAYEVIHNGILLLSKEKDQKIKFEIFSLKRHADTKRLRDIKRIYMNERITKGLDAYV